MGQLRMPLYFPLPFPLPRKEFSLPFSYSGKLVLALLHFYYITILIGEESWKVYSLLLEFDAEGTK